jgi:hypothetical protein
LSALIAGTSATTDRTSAGSRTSSTAVPNQASEARKTRRLDRWSSYEQPSTKVSTEHGRFCILGLQLLGLQAWVSDVFYGGVLVVAVTIATLLHRRPS